MKTKKNMPLSRGGKREGAGRPQGTGKYGEPTKAVRVPRSLVTPLQQFLGKHYTPHSPEITLQALKAKLFKSKSLPLFEDKVAAGFPSPAEDKIEKHLDLNEYVTQNPTTTFYVRVEGNSMLGAGIHPNDLLVVDLSLEAKNNQIIIAYLNGEFTVKRLKIEKSKKMWLIPENEAFSPVAITEEMDFRIWGVVTNVIHTVL